MNVLVTGADRGLGESIATLFAERGHQVFAGVLQAVGEGTGSFHRIHLDVSSDTSVAHALVEVQARTDHLDVLINNAAVLGDTSRSALEPLDFEEMLRVYNVNTLGALRVSQAFLPLLLAGQEKQIVNVSSEAGSIGTCWRDRWYAYAMSKAALNMQSVLLHRLLRGYGGQVVVCHPGHVRTFMRGTEDLTGSLSPREAAQRLLANVERAKLLSSEVPAFWGPEGETIPW